MQNDKEEYLPAGKIEPASLYNFFEDILCRVESGEFDDYLKNQRKKEIERIMEFPDSSKKFKPTKFTIEKSGKIVEIYLSRDHIARKVNWISIPLISVSLTIIAMVLSYDALAFFGALISLACLCFIDHLSFDYDIFRTLMSVKINEEVINFECLEKVYDGGKEILHGGYADIRKISLAIEDRLRIIAKNISSEHDTLVRPPLCVPGKETKEIEKLINSRDSDHNLH